MSPELDKKLCEKYPKIFADRFKPMNETAMCWGFECGDGWYDILEAACSQIQHHIEWKNRDGEKVHQVVAEQVKEKFGTLRFYTRGGDDYTQGVISMAEAMSGRVCEECGSPGETGGKGWISTLCDKHRKKIDADHFC